jgi:hypothetical protein
MALAALQSQLEPKATPRSTEGSAWPRGVGSGRWRSARRTTGCAYVTLARGGRHSAPRRAENRLCSHPYRGAGRQGGTLPTLPSSAYPLEEGLHRALPEMPPRVAAFLLHVPRDPPPWRYQESEVERAVARDARERRRLDRLEAISASNRVGRPPSLSQGFVFSLSGPCSETSRTPGISFEGLPGQSSKRRASDSRKPRQSGFFKILFFSDSKVC